MEKSPLGPFLHFPGFSNEVESGISLKTLDKPLLRNSKVLEDSENLMENLNGFFTFCKMSLHFLVMSETNTEY